MYAVYKQLNLQAEACYTSASIHDEHNHGHLPQNYLTNWVCELRYHLKIILPNGKGILKEIYTFIVQFEYTDISENKIKDYQC